MSQEISLTQAIDQRLAEAIETSNFRITLNNQKANARLKLQKDLTYSTNGGIFQISPELISFVQTLRSLGKETAILLDVNKNPVEIPDLGEFQDNIVGIYYERLNDFLIEIKGIQKSRTTKALVGE